MSDSQDKSFISALKSRYLNGKKKSKKYYENEAKKPNGKGSK